jgi:hypothetical protein
MLNKFLVFYASLMLTMGLLILFLLISAEIADISINLDQGKPTISSEVEAKPLASLLIATDKTTYTGDETIKITLENRSEDKLAQSDSSSLSVKARPDLGKNFEIAFIEQKIGNEWIAIEPVKRCASPCNLACQEKTAIEIGKKEVYVWNQEIERCNGDKTSTEKVPTGEYRVSTATSDASDQNTKMIHSNVFRISNLSMN